MAELYLVKAKPNGTLIWKGKVYKYGNEYEFKATADEARILKQQTTIISASKITTSVELENGLENKNNRKNTKANT